MKKTDYKITLILLISTLLVSSCSEDFLDRKPTSALTELSYFQNVAELETGLIACYGALGSFIGFEVDHYIIGDIGSDDADKGSTDDDIPEILDISYSRQRATNGWIYGVWSDAYAIIARCNEVIDKSAGIPADTLAEGAIKKIVNQAKFLRALCYYQLVTDFGDIPLLNKFMNPDELNLKRASASEVWAQIESDLKDATDLPTKNEWNKEENQSGRVTSGAAWSLLGKVYLTQRKYELANKAFSKVVSSDNYQLVPDFGFIFTHDGENCEESIFEIQHANHISGPSLGTWSGPFRLPRDSPAGWGFNCPTADLFDEFEQGDPRIIYTFMFKGDVFPLDGSSTYTVENAYSPTGYNSRKAWIPWSELTGLNWWEYDINYRYIRYAEVLLLYAESLNEVNKSDSARILVNLVRERARNTPTTDPQRISCAYSLPHPAELLPNVTANNQSDLRNAIWHEQRVELAVEGHRRNELLRTGRFKDRMEKAKKYAGVTVEPHELLLPVPQQEIELSNGLLTQNPGY